MEERFFRQKSRITWLRYGDHNTTFFHRRVQSCKAKNAIKKLVKDLGEEVTDPDLIKVEAVNYFMNFLQAASTNARDCAVKELS